MVKHFWLTLAVLFAIGLTVGSLGMYVWLEYRERGGLFLVGPAHHENTDTHECSDHADHDEHAGHDGHAEDSVSLSDEAARQFNLEITVASGGKLEQIRRLPAEISLNADRVAHLVPRVAGMVREVLKNVGDEVSAGELMAVLESRELAEIKAADLAAEARLKLAESSFQRVEELFRKKIASEQEYYESLHELEEKRIAHHETVAKLHALGLDHDELGSFMSGKEAEFSRYEIRAPFAGTVVAKHITLGEQHDSGSDVFLLADLSTVWVDITLYAQDANRVRPGQRIRVPSPVSTGSFVEGSIFFVSPILRESTRTGLARAALANDQGIWKPGLFITAEVILGEKQVDWLVPNEAVQWMQNQPVIFVVDDDAFQKRSVVIGEQNESHTEIVDGLRADERYVAKGAFILKAELLKGIGGHEH